MHDTHFNKVRCIINNTGLTKRVSTHLLAEGYHTNTALSSETNSVLNFLLKWTIVIDNRLKGGSPFHIRLLVEMGGGRGEGLMSPHACLLSSCSKEPYHSNGKL